MNLVPQLKRLFTKIQINVLNRVGGYAVELDLYQKLRERQEAAILEHLHKVGLLEAEIAAVMALAKLAKQLPPAAFLRALPGLSADTLAALPIEISSPDLTREHTRVAALYRQYLAGKSVIITGPAPHIVKSAQRAFIEKFDIVVRLNFQWPIPVDLVPDLGNRLDVLYHCCNGDLPVEALFKRELQQAKFVMMEQGILSRRLSRHCAGIGLPAMYISNVYSDLERQLGCPPTTGLVAVSHLLSFPIKELQTFGMTFGATGYYDSYPGKGKLAYAKAVPEKIWRHEPKKEITFAAKLCRRDPRLKLDQTAALEFGKLGYQITSDRAK